MTISWHLQMIEGWFWYQTSSFGMNFLKKYMKFFFGPKKAIFFAKRGPFWVPVTPSTRKFEILTLPYHFHIKFMLESTKKNMAFDLYEGAIDVQSCFLAIFAKNLICILQ